jgi:hypothetical protein
MLQPEKKHFTDHCAVAVAAKFFLGLVNGLEFIKKLRGTPGFPLVLCLLSPWSR